jgi:hypothetical protein
MIVAVILEGFPLGVRFGGVIAGAGGRRSGRLRGQNYRAGSDEKLNVALQVDRVGGVGASGESHRTAACGRGGVDRSVDRCGVDGFAVASGAERFHVEYACGANHGRRGFRARRCGGTLRSGGRRWGQQFVRRERAENSAADGFHHATAIYARSGRQIR